jgi:hypothetical protein
MRIQPVDPDQVEPPAGAVLSQQAQRWGGPLLLYLLYGRRPTIFRAVRGMWAGLDGSGLVDAATRALLNRRVAMLNRCPF